MKITKVILLISLAVILSVLYLNLTHNQVSAVDMETMSINQAEMQTVLEATIQIHLYPKDSLEALGVGQEQKSLFEALAEAKVEYRYEMGLGTLSSQNGEIILITHDHWGDLDELGMAQFRNAAGDPLLELDGDTFKELIRYKDGGTMILGRSSDGDPSDYFEAMMWISKAKYSQRVQTVALENGHDAGVGESVIVVRQGRNGSAAVELIIASVESLEERWGQLVYKLRNANGAEIMSGDSGGGIWLGGRLVGNMWKSMSTYGWNWDTLELEQQWTETSFAVELPNFVDEPLQSLETDEIVDDVETTASGEEF